MVTIPLHWSQHRDSYTMLRPRCSPSKVLSSPCLPGDHEQYEVLFCCRLAAIVVYPGSGQWPQIPFAYTGTPGGRHLPGWIRTGVYRPCEGMCMYAPATVKFKDRMLVLLGFSSQAANKMPHWTNIMNRFVECFRVVSRICEA